VKHLAVVPEFVAGPKSQNRLKNRFICALSNGALPQLLDI
jgi:hypothetical protein